jgi:phosphorylase/glycogen(starch) synthase
MTNAFTLFEVSWEVCNKVGGIYTVVSSKAKTLVERLGDRYVAIGPWLLGREDAYPEFEDEPGFADFTESCRAMGVPVRVGRWRIPGRPRTLLIEFSGLFGRKDGILAGLWERDHVDSLHGTWDYIEPVLFGHAAGLVIERWWEEYLASEREQAVAQFHEWMTGSGLLHLRERTPSIGTVFTTHATMLGRSLASQGLDPAGLSEGFDAAAAAREHDVPAKHSLEGVCAREADVFTTVSDLTAAEARLLHGRRAEPVLPNGIDLDVMDELCAGTTPGEARAALAGLATRFLGRDVSDALLIGISGRYEFHNKGLDVLLDALAELDKRPGRAVVLFVLVPAGNSGLRPEVVERLAAPAGSADGPLGLSTHNLFDAGSDPVHRRCGELGIANSPDARVAMIQVPIYLRRGDGLLDRSYEAVLQGLDLTCFPSFYEPWGYTPEESLAAGVPTVTTDCAGFGRWVREEGLRADDGVYVLSREGIDDAQAVGQLAAAIEAHLKGGGGDERERAARAAACRKTALRTAWTDLIRHYDSAFAQALAAARERVQRTGAPPFRPHRIEHHAVSEPSARPRPAAIDVAPRLPAPLAFLDRLARNLWWTWNTDAGRLFRDLSPRQWEETHHNPLGVLRRAFAADLEARAEDAAYLERLARVRGRMEAYLAEPPGEHRLPSGHVVDAAHPIAYLCAEFALHESLAIYSGGLGVLAGDHLKSASDLRLPLVGVGLFYRRGYFRQRIGPGGEQISLADRNDPAQLPLEPARRPDGEPVRLAIALPGSQLVLRAWRVPVGRVPLYLLDADLPENRPEDREITAQLYGGDHEGRLRQEIVLGRGGVQLLAALGLDPLVFHLNEGHAAFATLERVSALIARGLTFQEARFLVRSSTLFTTHTPVAAGHDRFAEDLMRRYFSDAPSWVGVPWERFFALGEAEEERGTFNMTYLALYFARWVNGVSRIHGEVSKGLLHPFYPRCLRGEVPVQAVTNGVHLATWTSPEIARVLGVEGRPVAPADFAVDPDGANGIDPHAAWAARNALRARLLDKLRGDVKRSFLERGESPRLLECALAGLAGAPLVLAFARRFAPYKRAHLLFRDVSRLAELCSDAERPVRILIAGKAHPRDTLGQELLSSIAGHARSAALAGKVFVLEDYDLGLAREMLSGADVWLNNPVRGLEASGTSGMKAACNGVLNLSVADGWWPEVEDPVAGWTLGEGRLYPSQELQDELDASSLYRLLESEVIPLFYDRDADGFPAGWMRRVVHALATIPPVFNTDRMVAEYRDRAYLTLADVRGALERDGHSALRAAVAHRERMTDGMRRVRVLGTRMEPAAALSMGDELELQLDVDLAGLEPELVIAEFLLGAQNGRDALHTLETVELRPVRADDGTWSFVGVLRLRHSGGFTGSFRLRARPLDAASVVGDLVIWA